MRNLFMSLFVICCFGVARAQSLDIAKPLSSIAISGYIEKSHDDSNKFCGYTYKPVRIEFAFDGSGFGVDVSLLKNINGYKKILAMAQNKMSRAYENFNHKSKKQIIGKTIFNKYTVEVFLYKVDLYHFGSRLVVTEGGKKYVAKYDYDFIDAVYPIKYEDAKYMVINLISCSASSCISRLAPYRLK